MTILYYCYVLTIVAILDSAMENRLFTSEMLDVLLRPELWRMLGSRFAQPVAGECESAKDGSGLTQHKHDHREVLFVLSGSGEFGAYGKAHACNRGTVFLLDSFEEHQLGYVSSQTDMDFLWVFLHEHVIGYQIDQVSSDSVKRASHLLHTERTCLSVANSVFGQPGPVLPEEFERREAHTGLVSLVLAIIREGYLVPVREDTKSFQRRVIFSVRDHIRETAGNGASLDKLAGISGYSKYHFLRLFREFVGVSVHEFIDLCRVERVIEMQRGRRSKKEIAATLGFSSLSAFSRWYSGVTMEPPVLLDQVTQA